MDLLKNILKDSAKVKTEMASSPELLAAISSSYDLILNSATNKGTVFAVGNGGSACDAMHLVEELVARYKADRPGVRAMHFVDAATITCWSNDYNYSGVFERYAQTFCASRDCLVAISTSGNSENILKAIQAAKNNGAKVIGLTGATGGKMIGLCDQLIRIPSQETARIQEAHITVIHAWCEMLDKALAVR